MSRFKPTISQENGEIDPNDNNPLLKVEDPAKTAEEDGSAVADDFEYVDAPEAIDGENQKQEDAIEEGEVLNKITEIDNIVKESENNSDTIQAIATVAAEMRAIIAEQGKFTPAQTILFTSAMESFEMAMPSITEGVTAMPSLESHSIVGLQYSNAQVSLEGVIERLDKGLNTLGLNISRLFKNGVGLANSLTPLFNRQLSRAVALKAELNNAHRDAGQKEVAGEFVSRLAIDGRLPDAQTVLRTTAYLSQCVGEILSDSATNAATRYIKSAQKGLEKSIDLDNIEHPNAWINLAIAFLPDGISGIVSKIKGIADRKKVMAQLKMDGNVTPELFKMYPTISKVNHPDGANKNLDYRRSLPLFNNASIVVSQYRPQITQRLNYHEVPAIKLEVAGGKEKGTVQALTAAQQKDVLDGVIQMLTVSRDFYKNYAQRNAGCMKAYQDAYNQRWEMVKRTTFENSSSTNIALPLFEYYTRLFWRGIFKEQAKLAVYVRKTSSALIDLASASAQQAQGGSPSQESINLNPFIGEKPKAKVKIEKSNPFI